MSERPLLVSGPLIGPILRGEKTVTRRLPSFTSLRRWDDADRDFISGTSEGCDQIGPVLGEERLWGWGRDNRIHATAKAPCAVGDVPWVRETWALLRLDYDWETGHVDDCEGVAKIPPTDPRIGDSRHQPRYSVAYAADDGWAQHRDDRGFDWRPSIHMPRWAARIFLRVESVTVERVQEITEEDAQREGVKAMGATIGDARPVFAMVWDSLAPAGSKWADNPFVWVVRFKLVMP